MTRDKHGRLTRSTFNYEKAQVTLVYEDDQTAKLIGLYSQHRGRGQAKAVMMEATQHADRHGIVLWLEVQQFGDPHGALENGQLIGFYERFGFELMHDGSQPPRMFRYPILEGDQV